MQNITDILVAMDARSDTQPAFERAVEVASRTNGRLHLATCDFVAGLSRAVFADEAQVEAARSRYLSSQEAMLRRYADRATRAGIRAGIETLWHRPRYEAILEAAQRRGAGMIIKAASDYSLSERILLGATDWELIRRAPQPLWLVKHAEAPVVNSNWVVAVDPLHPDEQHVGLDRKLLDTGCALAEAVHAKLHVFHAYAPPAMVAPTAGTGAAAPALSTLPEDTDAMLESRKRRVLDLMRAFDLPESRADVCIGGTVSQLDRIVANRRATLVIAGAVSRGTLGRLLLGSTAESLLHGVDCDILVVKPDSFPG